MAAVATSSRITAPATKERILDSALELLSSEGIAGVRMRAVARRADVAVGLVNYHFDNKINLIGAALERIGRQDLELVAAAAPGVDPSDHLIECLHRAVDSAFLTSDYLSLRLQLWSLAGVDQRFAQINHDAQAGYLKGLAALIADARPELTHEQANRRAADILIVQNGVWLTAILITDDEAVQRAINRCKELAFG